MHYYYLDGKDNYEADCAAAAVLGGVNNLERRRRPCLHALVMRESA